jgi:outer membrane protein OmpA-like peptidoglycan-associated protein
MLQRIILVTFIFMSKLSFAQDSTVVHFEFDRYDLTTEATQAIETLISKPNLYSASIFGHTDQLGSNSYNKKLSEQRANMVRDYLISKGVDAKKIRIVTGYGEERLMHDQLDEVSRQANRRVVIIAQYEEFAKESSVMEAPKKDVPVVTPQNTTPKENLLEKVTDTATKQGQNIILRNINFYGGRHMFLPEAYPPLQELLNVMTTIPTLEIEIQGHICCAEGDRDGIDNDTGEPFLSYNRARAVYDYLVKNGIERKRMSFRGFGHKFPIIQYERTEEERTTNRRVEIKILKK